MSDYEQGKFQGSILIMFEHIKSRMDEMSLLKNKEHDDIRKSIGELRHETDGAFSRLHIDNIKPLRVDVDEIKQWRWKWAAVAILVAFLGGIIGSVMSAMIAYQLNKSFDAGGQTGMIKANGASMAYHLPSCPSYAVTIIGNDPKDCYLSTEGQALTLGFHKAGNCPS